MSKAIDDLPQSISEILRNLALEEECLELAQIADYVDDMEDLLAYYRDTAKVLHEYATKYSSLKAGMRLLAGEGTNKLQNMDQVERFARYVLKKTDAYSVK
jgi:hypothetical protein